MPAVALVSISYTCTMRDYREDAKVKGQTATKRNQRQTKLHVLWSMEEIVAEYLKSSLI